MKKIFILFIFLTFLSGCEKKVSYNDESKNYEKETTCTLYKYNINSDDGMLNSYFAVSFSYDNLSDNEFISLTYSNVTFDNYKNAEKYYKENKYKYFEDTTCEVKKEKDEESENIFGVLECGTLNYEKGSPKDAILEQESFGFECELTK